MKKTLLYCAGLSVLGLALSIAFWNQVPDPFPIHWDSAGRPNGYASRTFGLLFGPALALGVPMLVGVISLFDERARKQTAWHPIVTGLSAFMVVLHGLMIRAALSEDHTLSIRTLAAVMGVGCGLMGFVLPRIQPNRIAGIRTPWTLADEKNWVLTHRFAGWSAKVGGVIAAASALVVPQVLVFWIPFAAIMVSFLSPVAFSWAIHKARPLGK